jgi:Protein tyrosine and serine/threonine kinase
MARPAPGSIQEKTTPFRAAVNQGTGNKGCSIRTLRALLTCLDVAKGMRFLHKSEKLHQDVSVHNVLLYACEVVRILPAVSIH